MHRSGGHLATTWFFGNEIGCKTADLQGFQRIADK